MEVCVGGDKYTNSSQKPKIMNRFLISHRIDASHQHVKSHNNGHPFVYFEQLLQYTFLVVLIFGFVLQVSNRFVNVRHNYAER